MPVVDVLVVGADAAAVEPGLASALANHIAAVLGAPPGRVWVRCQILSAEHYAENAQGPADLPAFLKILHAELPPPDALAAEASELARVVAACLKRPVERIHIEYAPAGRGRVAFGGQLLR